MKQFDITAKYPQVLAEAKRLATLMPDKKTTLTYWDEAGKPFDLVSHVLAATGFHPTLEWLKAHSHQHVMFWGDQAFADWAVAVFMTRLQRAIDRDLTWEKAVVHAERQTKRYFADPTQSLMIELMSREGYHPGSTKPEDVLSQ